MNEFSHELALSRLGIVLPIPASPIAAYVPVKVAGTMAFVAGQIPMKDGQMIASGRVGHEVAPDKAVECARQCGLNALAALRQHLGSLDRVTQIVRVGVFVACDEKFTDHPKIANGASELFQAVFGDAGKHARAAVGAPSLPRGAPVEVEVIAEIRG